MISIEKYFTYIYVYNMMWIHQIHVFELANWKEFSVYGPEEDSNNNLCAAGAVL